MVAARWRMARADRLLNIILSEFASGQNEPNSDDPEVRIAHTMTAKGDPVARLERHRAVHERTYHRCVRELRAARKERTAEQNEPNEPNVGQLGNLRPIVNRPPDARTLAPNPRFAQQNEPTGDAKTYIRPEPKIGRNDHCPSGSGLKYKNCCVRNTPTARLKNKRNMPAAEPRGVVAACRARPGTPGPSAASPVLHSRSRTSCIG